MHKFTKLMKPLLILLISLFSLSFISKDINDDLATYLKAGNAQSLAANFADKISIKILDVEDLISKAQAQALIEDFFAKHKEIGRASCRERVCYPV